MTQPLSYTAYCLINKANHRFALALGKSLSAFLSPSSLS